jgi:hypothetical protein
MTIPGFYGMYVRAEFGHTLKTEESGEIQFSPYLRGGLECQTEQYYLTEDRKYPRCDLAPKIRLLGEVTRNVTAGKQYSVIAWNWLMGAPIIMDDWGYQWTCAPARHRTVWDKPYWPKWEIVDRRPVWLRIIGPEGALNVHRWKAYRIESWRPDPLDPLAEDDPVIRNEDGDSWICSNKKAAGMVKRIYPEWVAAPLPAGHAYSPDY